MIVVIPVIDRSMMLAYKQVMITGNIVLDNHPFNADGKFGGWWRGILKNTFAEEWNAVVQFGRDKKVLLAKAERSFPLFVGDQPVYKAPDLRALAKRGGWKKVTSKEQEQKIFCFSPG